MKKKAVLIIPLLLLVYILAFYLIFFVFNKRNIVDELNLTWNTKFSGEATLLTESDYAPRGEHTYLYKIKLNDDKAVDNQLNAKGSDIYDTALEILERENMLNDSKEALDYLKSGKYKRIKKDEDDNLYMWNGENNSIYVLIDYT
ncbi:hypothetical protein SAMN05216249_110104 [Acetitomaculum ruminis DSM 5522]|uniref:Uncharacterized protein n=1 Tax=Acetitomaculum ruminis DSM 5522 TaxID=1120918 RepID=A0A1I0YM34_9FIRM|nr:hypothetical protein [Acetitomaculum ruminis]SFB14262.1 hypothetical protein SAMN05216249_110104 [Acetitomaculum ruminis DSM 5522]